jgi:hypothetical protein
LAYLPPSGAPAAGICRRPEVRQHGYQSPSPGFRPPRRAPFSVEPLSGA